MPTKTEAAREADQARYEIKLKLLALANSWRDLLHGEAEIASLLKIIIREIPSERFDEIAAIFRGEAVDERSREEQVEALAEAFTRHLTEEIGEDKLRFAARENARRGDDGTCASHDECDANMPMLDAFKETFGREPAFLGDAGSPEADVDTALINDAWDKAKLAWPT